jgi:hypothetical protein
LPQLETKALDNFSVHEIQKYGTLVEQSNFYAKSCKHGRVFQADNSGAHYNQIARHFFKTVNLIRIEDSFAVNWDISTVRWARTTL